MTDLDRLKEDAFDAMGGPGGRHVISVQPHLVLALIAVARAAGRLHGRCEALIGDTGQQPINAVLDANDEMQAALAALKEAGKP